MRGDAREEVGKEGKPVLTTMAAERVSNVVLLGDKDEEPKPRAPKRESKRETPKRSRCKRCDGDIVWNKSKRTGKFYPTNSRNPRDFHRCG